MKKVAVVTILIFSAFEQSFWGQERKPLEKPQVRKPLPKVTAKRKRYDPRTGKWVEYDTQAKLALDENGNLVLSWIGTDGELKRIIVETRNKVDVVVEAQVEYKPGLRRYKYLYKLNNLASSKQELVFFSLRVESAIEDVRDAGWHFSDRNVLTRKYSGNWVDWLAVGRSAIPVPPGGQKEGFSFQSAGLPGIVECIVFGDAPGPIGVGEEMPWQLEDAWVASGVTGPDSWPRGKTIGPVDIEEPFDPQAFLQHLMAMLEESLSLGWVDGVETVNLFTVKLVRVSQALRDKDERLAKSLLEEVIEEAERLKETQLTSEVYAMLRYNAQYLIQTLR